MLPANAGSENILSKLSIPYTSLKPSAGRPLIEKPVKKNDFRVLPGDNTALAISIAEFGMVLRESEYRGTSSLESAESIARAVAEDTDSDLVRSYADLIGTLRKQSDEIKE